VQWLGHNPKINKKNAYSPNDARINTKVHFYHEMAMTLASKTGLVIWIFFPFSAMIFSFLNSDNTLTRVSVFVAYKVRQVVTGKRNAEGLIIILGANALHEVHQHFGYTPPHLLGGNIDQLVQGAFKLLHEMLCQPDHQRTVPFNKVGEHLPGHEVNFSIFKTFSSGKIIALQRRDI
jgi:hypothetical protein